MNKKILVEDTPPKIVADLHVPMALFILSAAAAVGAAIIRLVHQSPD